MDCQGNLEHVQLPMDWGSHIYVRGAGLWICKIIYELYGLGMSPIKGAWLLICRGTCNMIYYLKVHKSPDNVCGCVMCI